MSVDTENVSSPVGSFPSRAKGSPVVSVGLPVFNGGSHLRRALESLLAQTFPSLQVLIRDNASSDQTESIGREYEARDPRVRYVRNGSNVGAVRNFQLALEEAVGTYFMWAAHDDCWSRDYVERLVRALRREPGAVLAAGRATFMDPEGSPIPGAVDSSAPVTAVDPWQTLLDGHATHWIYGLFDRARLKELAPNLAKLRPWGGDMVWLMSLATSGAVTGDDEALVYKTLKPSSYCPSGARAVTEWQFWYLRELLGAVLHSRLAPTRKWKAMGSTCSYWWGHVTEHGRAVPARTWLAGLRDIAFRRRREEHSESR